MPAKKTMAAKPGGVKARTPKTTRIAENTPLTKQILSNGQVVKYQTQILDMLSQMNDDDTADLLYRAGVGSRYFTCQMCGKVRPQSEFYKTTSIRMRTGYTSICKECAQEIAYGADETGHIHGITKTTLCNALEYLDKPFVEKYYEEAVENSGDKKKDIWSRYMNSLSTSKKYRGYRWRDSETIFKKSAGYDEMIEDTEVEVSAEDASNNQEQYEINRRDTIKFCGYDPFVNEAETDKPRLYAKLVGFLDDQAKEDPFKLSSIIEIVKGLAQSEKLNDEITALLNNKATLIDNNAVLNKLMDTRKKCLDTVQTLARDNGISINYNKNSSAGQQTLSGRIKKVTEENLREGRVNLFDIGTCAGMQQIAEISEAARAKQLGFNEDIAREIKDTSTALVTGLTKERDEYKERCRILLRENLDLKEFLREKDLIDEHNVAISDE